MSTKDQVFGLDVTASFIPSSLSKSESGTLHFAFQWAWELTPRHVYCVSSSVDLEESAGVGFCSSVVGGEEHPRDETEDKTELQQQS